MLGQIQTRIDGFWRCCPESVQNTTCDADAGISYFFYIDKDFLIINGRDFFASCRS